MLRWLNSNIVRPSRYVLNIRQPLTKPYHGLALEEYWFNKLQFQEEPAKKLILLWRNQPSVVLGKFQNAWSECHPQYCRGNGVYVARRFSGGGTVFHDPGNLNITVFANAKNYKRKENLQLVKSTLETSLNYTDLEINERDDLLWEGKKISGTAAKLNSRKSYHHFTLLFNTNKELLSGCLKSPLQGWNLHCKATKSVPSPTANLLLPNASFDETESSILKFSKGLASPEIDPKTDISTEISTNQEISKFSSHVYEEIDCFDDLRAIDPDIMDFEEIEKISDELESWEWIWGKSPKFKLNDKEIIKGKTEKGKRFYL